MESNEGRELVEQLQDIPPDQFEEFIADLWENDGYHTRVVGKSGDRGIDVIAERDNLVNERILIQAKRYNSTNTVGSPEIQQYASLAHQQENVDKAVVVTTSQFSSQGRELAKQHNLDLVDGEGLESHIIDNQLESLVRNYVSDSTQEGDNVSHRRNKPDVPNQIKDTGQQFSIELVALRDENDLNKYTNGQLFERGGNLSNRIVAFVKIENLGEHMKTAARKIFSFISDEGYEYEVDVETSGIQWLIPGDWSSELGLSHGQSQDIVLMSTEIPHSVTISKIELRYEGEVLEFHIPPEVQNKLEDNTLDIDMA